LSPRKIDKVYKNVYFSEQKTIKPEKPVNEEKLNKEKTPKNKRTSSTKKIKGLGPLNNSPYYKEIMNHNKGLAKNQTKKELNIKT